jgi:hypothetical protein
MKLHYNGNYIDANIINTLSIGDVVDVNIELLEQRISAYYGVSVASLTDWMYDTDAKKMLCFLLCHYLHYSIGSVAVKYKINALYLRQYITEQYKNCLLKASEKSLVDGFFNNTNIVLKTQTA